MIEDKVADEDAIQPTQALDVSSARSEPNENLASNDDNTEAFEADADAGEPVSCQQRSASSDLPEADKDAILDSVYQDLQQAQAELQQEKQLSKSLQDMLKTLSDTLKQVEAENESLKEVNSEMGVRSKTDNDSRQLAERIRVLEESHEEKDQEMTRLNSKMAESECYSPLLYLCGSKI